MSYSAKCACDRCGFLAYIDISAISNNFLPENWRNYGPNQAICPDCMKTWKNIEQKFDQMRLDFWKNISEKDII